MRHITNELRHQIRRHRRETSRVLALFLALTMIVSLGIDLGTTSQVYASENDSTYTCGKEEHDHSIQNGCYALTCDLEESEGHTHTLDCYEGVEPTCGQEEMEATKGHTHDLDCYGDKVLTCENEDPDHEHTADCYDLGDSTCGQEEAEATEGHTHTLDCYDGAEPICGEEESDGHKHTEDCYNLDETICGKEEHEHTEACKATDDSAEDEADTEESNEDEICGETYTSNETSETTTRARKSARVMRSPAANTADGYDMGSNIGSVVFKKKVGSMWVESDTFTTADQIQGTINFNKIYTSTIKNSNYTVYVDLPEGIDCSNLLNNKYETTDNGQHSGYYHFVENEDGTYRMVLEFDHDYVNNAGDTIGGNMRFQFEWDDDIASDEGKVPIEIGDWSGEVTITKDESKKEESTSANYNIYKQAGGLTIDDDGYAYIEYTVTLTVKKEMAAPVNLKDVLSGEGFTYVTGDSNITITSQNGSSAKVNYGTTYSSGTSTQIQVWPLGTEKVQPDIYTIKYKVKSTQPVTDPDVKVVDGVKNTISVPDGSDDAISSETYTSTTTGTINKQGELVSGTDATYIDYTVYLNAGDIIKNLKKAADFSDTLPDTVELVEGSLSVKQYDVTGTETDNSKNGSIGSVNVNGQQLTYSTPTGQYYYVITYRVKVKDSEVPFGGSVTVKNDGKSTGGIDGSSSSEITVDNKPLRKTYNSQGLTQGDDDKWYNVISWTSYIDVTGSLDGYIYEDWGGLMMNGDNLWYAPQYMTDEQFKGIVVTDVKGNVVDRSKYTLERSERENTDNRYDSDGNLVKDGLYKITFSSDVTGPVTITYSTTVDMSNFKYGEYTSAFINYASLTKDGKTTKAQAQTGSLWYNTSTDGYISKFGISKDNFGETSGSITLEPGQTSIPWFIRVNNDKKMTGTLVITDTIAENLTYLPDTLTIATYKGDIKNAEGVTYDYNETTRKLTITIPFSAYENTDSWDPDVSRAVFISFRTQLPDEFIKGSSTTTQFENTAAVENNGNVYDSTYTYDVIQEVVGKGGTYDDARHELTYNVYVNPDGASLNEGKTLTVEDTLGLYDGVTSDFLDHVTLESLQLFEPIKTTDAEGNVTITPGKFVQALTLVESGTEEFTYTYDDTTKTFKTYLPDAKGYVIVAGYKVDDDYSTSDYIRLKNTVSLTGSKEWKKEDSSLNIKVTATGETWSGNRVTVVKRDASQYSTLLEGAEFRLERYDSGSKGWTQVGEKQTTDSKGEASWLQDENNEYIIQYDTLYRLTETKAPHNYEISEGPTYFIIVKESKKATAKDGLPNSISGENTYGKSAVRVITVKEDTQTDTYYANVVIDRYDEQDKTPVEPGQLRVTKVWKDYQGNTLTGSNIPDKVASVTLTKHVPNTGVKVMVTANGSSKTITVNPGGSIEFKGVNGYRISAGTTWTGWSCTDSSVDETHVADGDNWTVTVGPFNQDCTITSEALYWDSVYNKKATATGGTAAEGTIDTVIGTVELNDANDWTYLWSDLDRTTDGVTYTLTEQTVSGYKTTYTINGSDLEAGKTFEPGASGDKIVVTNQEDSTSLKVHKVWNDGGAEHLTDRVTIYLVRNGTRTDQYVTLSSQNDWTATFTGLLIKDADGNPYEYTVVEDPVPDDYSAAYEYGTDPEDPDQPIATVTNTKQYDLPSTGGAGTLPYMLGGSAALISSMFAGCSMRRRRRDERRCD